MSKVTKYLLKRISQLEEELFSVKNRNAILEDEIIGLESENKNLQWSVEEGDSLISKLENKIEKLSPKPKPESTFGHLDAFKELKEQLLKEEQEWREKQDKDN